MGKIRISKLGGSEEELLRQKQKIKREEKKKREKSQKIHIAGMKGGERIKAVAAESEEELEKLAKLAQEVEKDQAEGIKTAVKSKEEKPKRKIKTKSRSKRYKEALLKIEHNKLYPINEAISLLHQISLTNFDPTVEVHINTVEKGLRGQVLLPHGTGKKIRVAIADTETIEKMLTTISNNQLDFDVLIAHPAVMPKLAKVAKILGPKGLMPNPKAGTISEEPEKVAEKYKKGEITWKTESEFPIVHQVIGKLSFKDSQLKENFETLIHSIGASKIKSITLKTTMSPGIKVQV